MGMGPGDPDLVTVGAVKALRAAAAVVVPVADTGEAGRAEATARAHLDPGAPVHRVVFALDDPGGLSPRRQQAWDAAGARVVQLLRDTGGPVAFATLGDPNVYSTFSYLAATVRALEPAVAVVTVPGITAMQALAARTGTPLVEGTETLALLPLTAGVDQLAAALARFDTVVGYKGGARLDAVLATVRAAGRLDAALAGAALGLPGEKVGPARDWAGRGGAPYLTTLLVPPHRGGRGGRL